MDLSSPTPATPAWRALLPLVLVGVVLTALSIFLLDTFAGVRTMHYGESLWSKSRSEAVAHLRHYLHAGDADDLSRFEAALAGPLGERRAREAMDRPGLDPKVVREGALAGGIHADDIAAKVRLYRRFAHWPLLDDVVAQWRTGDQLIAELRALAAQARACADVESAAACRASYVPRVDALDERLLVAERRYLEALGHASRRAERVLEMGCLVLGVVLTAGAVGASRRTLKRDAAAARALAEATRRWRLAALASGLGLFEWNPVGDVYRCNARALELLGLNAPPGQPVRGADLHARMHPEDRAAACRDLDTAAAAPGAVLRQRCRLLLDDGRERVVELVGRMEERGGGGVMVGMVRDVTDEEARARLQIERDAMARAAQARMDFLSRLSHELRTPLNAVLGFAQLLMLDPLPPVQRDRVQTIEAAGRRLLALIEDVLDLTRLDEGAVQLVLAPVELGDAVRAAAALVEPARRAAAVALRLRLDDGAVHAMADAQRLRQVLVALLTNACHYNRPGGEIDVSVRRTDADAATVEVSDTGYGMTPQELSVVFQPLAHAGRASGTEGAGLGLAISKLLMTRMGGQIRVASSPAGSVFTLQLKAAPPPAPAGASPADVRVDAVDDPAVDLAARPADAP